MSITTQNNPEWEEKVAAALLIIKMSEKYISVQETLGRKELVVIQQAKCNKKAD